MRLTETTYGYTFTAAASCTGSAWSTTIFPGTYKVEVSGIAATASNVPLAYEVVKPALALTASTANVALDVKSVAVSGTVTINGAVPTVGGDCAYYGGTALVRLTETTYGYTFTAAASCTGSTWSTTIFPGTYKVEVSGIAATASNVPLAYEVVIPRIYLP